MYDFLIFKDNFRISVNLDLSILKIEYNFPMIFPLFPFQLFVGMLLHPQTIKHLK